MKKYLPLNDWGKNRQRFYKFMMMWLPSLIKRADKPSCVILLSGDTITRYRIIVELRHIVSKLPTSIQLYLIVFVNWITVHGLCHLNVVWQTFGDTRENKTWQFQFERYYLGEITSADEMPLSKTNKMKYLKFLSLFPLGVQCSFVRSSVVCTQIFLYYYILSVEEHL